MNKIDIDKMLGNLTEEQKAMAKQCKTVFLSPGGFKAFREPSRFIDHEKKQELIFTLFGQTGHIVL